MITLVLDASTYAGSVAVLHGDRLAGECTVAMRGREREALMPAVAALLEELDVAPRTLGRIVCGAGPGSFTSLRIAGAIAKGLALAVGAPLVPVSSLALMVGAHAGASPGRYLALLDALRGEYHAQPFSVDQRDAPAALGPVTRVAAADVAELAAYYGARSIGPDREGDARAEPHARGAVRLLEMLDEASPVILAGWEPAYGRAAEAQVKWEAAHGRPLPR